MYSLRIKYIKYKDIRYNLFLIILEEYTTFAQLFLSFLNKILNNRNIK